MRFLPVLVVGVLSFAQDAGRLEFDVASIKPAAPPSGGRGGFFLGIRGGPGTPDPGRIQYNGMPLKMLIVNAYDVKPFQVTGPGWIDSPDVRFDIVATVPQGATKEQVRLMLQNLLADRFKLAIHHETKELPVYELLVAKNGPKLKASVEDPDASKPGADRPPGPPPIGKDGMPQLPPGRKGQMMMRGPKGMRIMAGVQSMTDLANMLGTNLGSPVVDKTGLTGTYDYTLDFSPEGAQGALPGLPPLPGPPPAGGGIAGAGGATHAEANDQSEQPNLFTAIQEQLGLRLNKTKGPVDIIVIDRAEKTPTEN